MGRTRSRKDSGGGAPRRQRLSGSKSGISQNASRGLSVPVFFISRGAGGTLRLGGVGPQLGSGRSGTPVPIRERSALPPRGVWVGLETGSLASRGMEC